MSLAHEFRRHERAAVMSRAELAGALVALEWADGWLARPRPPERPKRKLPTRTRLEVVGPESRRYPAWIERWTRRVVAVCGEVSLAVPVVIVGPHRPACQRLKEKLERWGYQRVLVEPLTRRNRFKRKEPHGS